MDSFKKVTIRTVAMAPQTEIFAGNKLILVTAAGIITGTLTDKNSEKPGDIAVSAMLDMIAEVNENEPEGNDGSLLLSDVTVINGNVRYNLPNLIVFYDQIIGATLGSSI